MGALLRCKDLSKFYTSKDGRKTVFSSLSFEVDSGQGLFICGPNGAGKTTLLSILAGLVGLSEGAIELNDRSLTPLSHGLRHHIGFSPASENSLFLNATVRENLEFWAKLQSMPRDRAEKIRSLASRWGFETYLDRTVREISSGYRRRVALARAFLHGPSLVLLDEPLAFLDTENQERTLASLEQWLNEKKGALIVSSNVEFARGENWKRLNLLEHSRSSLPTLPSPSSSRAFAPSI